MYVVILSYSILCLFTGAQSKQQILHRKNGWRKKRHILWLEESKMNVRNEKKYLHDYWLLDFPFFFAPECIRPFGSLWVASMKSESEYILLHCFLHESHSTMNNNMRCTHKDVHHWWWITFIARPEQCK